MKIHLPYSKQSINDDDIAAVTEALKNPIITRGPQMEAFELEFAEYCGAQFAVAFSNASSGLAAAYFAAGVKAGDKIISTPNTFVASVGTAVQRGAQTVFIDIDFSTGNVDLEQFAHNGSLPLSRGRAILAPVHFAGLPVDMELLDQQLANPDTVVVEDAAHALGSYYPRGGPRIGSCKWSHMTVFSFHPVKNITSGEGGMVTTNSEEFAHALRLFRNNGIERDPAYLEEKATPWHYEVHALTNNYFMTEMQAALGRSQLKRIGQFLDKKRHLVKLYREKLKGHPAIQLLSDAYDEHTGFHLLVAHIDFDKLGIRREDLMLKLREKGIGTQVHYIPLYRHPAFKAMYGELADYFPQMEKHYAQALSLPLFYDMEDKDVAFVVENLKA